MMKDDVRRRIIEKALLSRRVEEKLLDLFAQGKLFGTVHTCIGQEFSGAVLSEFIQPGDTIFSNHRCHGHFLSTRDNVLGLIAEIMGKTIGVCGGIGGSQHLCQEGFYSNGIQGGIVPVATGLALAHKIQKNKKISYVFIGDGTLGEGALYEAMNIAAKWELPLVIVLENNLYAQSTSQSETLAGDIRARAEAFGISTFHATTWKWEELYDVSARVHQQVSETGRPCFLQVDTYRLKAHSKGDDNRAREEVDRYLNQDPLQMLLQKNEDWLQQADRKIMGRIEDALAVAHQAPVPTIEKQGGTWYRDNCTTGEVRWSEHQPPKKRLAQRINETLHQLMQSVPGLEIIGEDILSPYGGAFKVTQGLSASFPDRVRNTPISEAAITGIGCGLALAGLRPFVEIMFGDFTGLAFDQLVNHAAKFEFMYFNQVHPHLVVRTPMGGLRGYGPTHSQTLDRHFLGVPGLRVVAVNNLMDPAPVYEELARGAVGPTLLIENKVQYAQSLRSELPAGFRHLQSNEKFPTVAIVPDASRIDFTLLGYGGVSDLLVDLLDKCFVELDLIGQVICPTQIYPFRVDPFLPLLQKSSALIVIEEGQKDAGWGAEVLAQLAERSPALLQRTLRIGPNPAPIPSSGELEKQFLPTAGWVLAEIQKFAQRVQL